jgi:heat shock protein HslJ
VGSSLIPSHKGALLVTFMNTASTTSTSTNTNTTDNNNNNKTVKRRQPSTLPAGTATGNNRCNRRVGTALWQGGGTARRVSKLANT